MTCDVMQVICKRMSTDAWKCVIDGCDFSHSSKAQLLQHMTVQLCHSRQAWEKMNGTVIVFEETTVVGRGVVGIQKLQ